MDNGTPTDQGQQQSTPKQQVVERLRQASNVLVTVKSNPSVDELAATIGLTLLLNKLEKHTTAVFSGNVPSTLEFLKPDETLETNTDSLRDFIVSLDKSKADKLRYKVEENVVKIFITPYRTSISESDLEFTQGDFNVDAVVALGVTKREELDNAITSHGRILHDATFITVTAGQDFSELGQINWQEQGASSLSEMLVSISEAFQGGLIDTQIATAFLTGIVAETERFSNTKTTPKVMTMSAQLMAAGANQQLIANELEKATEVDLSGGANVAGSGEATSSDDSVESSDGTLSISHSQSASTDSEESTSLNIDKQAEPVEQVEAKPAEPLLSPFEQEKEQKQQADVGEEVNVTSSILPPLDNPSPELNSPSPSNSVEANTQPQLPSAELLEGLPGLQETLVSNSSNDDDSIHIDTEGNLLRKNAISPKHKVIQPATDVEQPLVENLSEFNLPEPGAMQDNETAEETSEPVDDSVAPEPTVIKPEQPDPMSLPPLVQSDIPEPKPIQDDTTLAEIEQAVNSPHLKEQEAEPDNVDEARNAVNSALGSIGNPPIEPRTDLNAMPLSAPPESVSYDAYRLPTEQPNNTQVNNMSGNVPDASLGLPPLQNSSSGPEVSDQMAPPPVPPPIVPPGQQAL